MERPKREPPARTAPIRDVRMMFRPAVTRDGRAAAAREPARSHEAPAPADGVDRGVGVAYRVLDDYLRRGRSAAERHGDEAARRDALPRDPQDFARRAVRYWADMMSMWVDYVTPLVPADAAFRPPWMPAEPGPPAPAPSRSDAESASRPGAAPLAAEQRLGVAVAVASSRPAEVVVDVHRPLAGARLVAQPLQPIDGSDEPAIREVKLAPADGGRLHVTVTIPPEQPAGVYLGAVFDAVTGEARGTLRVVLR